MIANILTRNDFIIKQGCHTENVIIIPLEGSFEFCVDEKNYTAGPNSVVYFQKVKHFRRRVLSPLKIIYIQYVSGSFNTGILQFKDAGRISSTIRLLKKAILENNYSHSMHYINDLLMQYNSENENITTRYSADVLGFMEYVEKNYQNKISVKAYSDKVFMSQTGFLLKFKRETKLTPSEYIQKCRLNAATDLLLNSQSSISEIASQCGYENVYYFSTAFKKRYGSAPSVFRKNNV